MNAVVPWCRVLLEIPGLYTASRMPFVPPPGWSAGPAGQCQPAWSPHLATRIVRGGIPVRDHGMGLTRNGIAFPTNSSGARLVRLPRIALSQIVLRRQTSGQNLGCSRMWLFLPGLLIVTRPNCRRAGADGVRLRRAQPALRPAC